MGPAATAVLYFTGTVLVLATASQDGHLQKGLSSLFSVSVPPEGPCEEREGCQFVFNLLPMTGGVPAQLKDLERVVEELQLLKDNVDQLRKICRDCGASQAIGACPRGAEVDPSTGALDKTEGVADEGRLEGKREKTLAKGSREQVVAVSVNGRITERKKVDERQTERDGAVKGAASGPSHPLLNIRPVHSTDGNSGLLGRPKMGGGRAAEAADRGEDGGRTLGTVSEGTGMPGLKASEDEQILVYNSTSEHTNNPKHLIKTKVDRVGLSDVIEKSTEQLRARSRPVWADKVPLGHVSPDETMESCGAARINLPRKNVNTDDYFGKEQSQRSQCQRAEDSERITDETTDEETLTRSDRGGVRSDLSRESIDMDPSVTSTSPPSLTGSRLTDAEETNGKSGVKEQLRVDEELESGPEEVEDGRDFSLVQTGDRVLDDPSVFSSYEATLASKVHENRPKGRPSQSSRDGNVALVKVSSISPTQEEALASNPTGSPNLPRVTFKKQRQHVIERTPSDADQKEPVGFDPDPFMNQPSGDGLGPAVSKTSHGRKSNDTDSKSFNGQQPTNKMTKENDLETSLRNPSTGGFVEDVIRSAVQRKDVGFKVDTEPRTPSTTSAAATVTKTTRASKTLPNQRPKSNIVMKPEANRKANDRNLDRLALQPTPDPLLKSWRQKQIPKNPKTQTPKVRPVNPKRKTSLQRPTKTNVAKVDQSADQKNGTLGEPKARPAVKPPPQAKERSPTPDEEAAPGPFRRPPGLEADPLPQSVTRLSEVHNPSPPTASLTEPSTRSLLVEPGPPQDPVVHQALRSTPAPRLRHKTPAVQTSPPLMPELRGKTDPAAAFQNKTGPTGRPLDLDPGEASEGSRKPDQKAVRDCSGHLLRGHTHSGLYLVTPDPSGDMVRVMCDMEAHGGGWTVLQRRQDGSVSFNRTWAEYRGGFGRLEGEFWLGNELLHLLTWDGRMELRVELEDFSGVQKHAHYELFKVAGERLRYRLSVDGFSGTAGDALRFGPRYDHNNRPFTTADRDNDQYLAGNCGAYYSSGWWFDACMAANLNGRYYKGGYRGIRDGIYWGAWPTISTEHYLTKERVAFRSVRMMMRPRGF